ncbi:alpha-1,2-mannosyltransferase [Schizosaccharomyces japonicus yFS275]|uniref:Alpha-1,2-mannosyltransferase n=1 Tax=Schizosaccharomyces japonicus (strain yFS275 / FY16936) TaxID=402676 RepID=B6K073_SCHJY|nr:alpha-1,2-mannosyltransferase [Schizosaccharomyces japonicus yFS275]EEB06223.1 alpha-1,2-mannosyltransferase [Schizosaccharomyces japonicus yFS275]
MIGLPNRLVRFAIVASIVLTFIFLGFTQTDKIRQTLDLQKSGILGGNSEKKPEAPHEYYEIKTHKSQPNTDYLPDGRVNAAFVTLVRNEDLHDMLLSIERLENRFNKRYHYPWVFLNDKEFTEEFKTAIRAAVSGGAEFGFVEPKYWSIPSHIDQDKMHASWRDMEKNNIIYGGSESYRHMCRFESGFFYRHPLVSQYEYYWRVEPSVDFYCDIDFDPFVYMKENEKLYAFTISLHEYAETVTTLWDVTKAFVAEHPTAIHPNNTLEFISDDNGQSYNMCHFWSNFEIASVNFWTSEPYASYFEYLDRMGGFFYERWGDAPVHSIAAALFMDRKHLHFFNEIGYYHPGITHCPIEDEFRSKCSCRPSDTIDFNGYSCNKHWYEVMNIPFPQNYELYLK